MVADDVEKKYVIAFQHSAREIVEDIQREDAKKFKILLFIFAVFSGLVIVTLLMMLHFHWKIESLEQTLVKNDEHTRKELNNTKQQMILSFWKMRDQANPAIPILVKALEDENNDVRRVSALALEEVGRDSDSTVFALIKALKDQDARVRRHAVLALWKRGEKADAASSDLIAAIKDSDEKVREVVPLALEDVGRNDPAAIPALMSILKNPEAERRDKAVIALKKRSEKVDQEVAILMMKLRQDSNVKVRREAVLAIPAFKHLFQDMSSLVSALGELLDDADEDVRFYALEALSRFGAKAQQSIPLIQKKLEDPSDKVKEAARQALQTINVNKK